MVHTCTHGTVTAKPLDLLQYLLHTLLLLLLQPVASNILFWSFAICVELAARHGALLCPKRTVGVLSDQKKGSWEREGRQERKGEPNSDDRLWPVGRLAWPTPAIDIIIWLGEACVSSSSSSRRRSRHSKRST